MAFAGQTVTNLAYALTDVVEPEINEQIFKGTKTLDQIKKIDISDEVGTNLRHYTRLRLNRTWNSNFVTTSAGYYPAPRYITGIKPYLSPKVLQTTIGFDKGSLLASRSAKGGVASVLEEETVSKIKEIKELQDMLLWAGHYGHLGYVASTSGSVDTWTAAPYPFAEYQVQYMMYLDSYDAVTAGSQGMNSKYVASVSSNAVTMNTTTGSTAGEWIFLEDTYAYCPNTIPEMVDNYALRATSSTYRDGTALDTVMGQARSSYTQLEANVVHNSNSSTAMTLDDLEIACNKGEFKIGKQPTHIWSCDGARGAYLALIRPDRRYTENYLTVNGGWRAMEYSHGGQPIPWLTNRHCPRGTVWLLHMPALYLAILQPFEFDLTEGSKLQRQVDSTGTMNAYVAYGDLWYNLGCDDFQAQTVYRDVLTTSHI